MGVVGVAEEVEGLRCFVVETDLRHVRSWGWGVWEGEKGTYDTSRGVVGCDDASVLGGAGGVCWGWGGDALEALGCGGGVGCG